MTSSVGMIHGVGQLLSLPGGINKKPQKGRDSQGCILFQNIFFLKSSVLLIQPLTSPDTHRTLTCSFPVLPALRVCTTYDL
mmetsp:Transcript_17422/g.19660  ORF Transcript_17422/g.19660 Transcript_17422/m.19660 type:complete len:81 (+) Transcript_17422:882-1124(+)